jgi:sugar (pentulose or hexulose) kinase
LPDNQLLQNLKPELHKPENKTHAVMTGQSAFSKRELTSFANYETAYHQLMTDIMVQQVHSTNLVLKGTHVQRIFVDGGFSENPIYMYLLAAAFPETEIYAAAMAQASALGAAMVIHRHWNSKAFPADIIDLKLYTDVQENSI